MASFYVKKQDDGSYYGRTNWMGLIIEHVAKKFSDLWEFFINRLNGKIGK